MGVAAAKTFAMQKPKLTLLLVRIYAKLKHLMAKQLAFNGCIIGVFVKVPKQMGHAAWRRISGGRRGAF